MVACCAVRTEWGVAGSGGPLDGYVFEVNPKRIPEAVQFHLTGKRVTRDVWCVYEWEPEQRAFVYAGTFDEDPKLACKDDCVSKPYLEFKGEGAMYCVWKTVTQLKGEIQ